MAAWAAIWLAVSPVGVPGWAIPICDRFEVLVDGSVASNRPCVCECFREWCPPPPRLGGSVRGEAVRTLDASLVGLCGREKLRLGCDGF